MSIGPVDKQLIFTTAKEILIKALENTRPFAAAFDVEKANGIGDVFNALVTKVAESLKGLG